MLNRVSPEERQKQMEIAKAEEDRQAAERQRLLAEETKRETQAPAEPDWDEVSMEAAAEEGKRQQPARASLPTSSAKPVSAQVKDFRTPAPQPAAPTSARVPAAPSPSAPDLAVRQRAAALLREQFNQKPKAVIPDTTRNPNLPPVENDPIFKTLEAITRMKPLEKAQMLEASTRGMEFDVICRDPQTGRRFVIDKGRVLELTPRGPVPVEGAPEFLRGYEAGDLIEEKTVIDGTSGQIKKSRKVHRKINVSLQF